MPAARRLSARVLAARLLAVRVLVARVLAARALLSTVMATERAKESSMPNCTSHVEPRRVPLRAAARTLRTLVPRRATAAALVAVVLALAVGHAGEPPTQYGPVGGLLEVDGRTVHLECSGEGSVLVVLIPDIGDSIVTLEPLHAEVARFARVCSYERAGYGLSDPGPEPRDLLAIRYDLGALLSDTFGDVSYVYVGRGFGGMIALEAATGSFVDGAVLIDPWHPDLIDLLEDEPALAALFERLKASAQVPAAAAEFAALPLSLSQSQRGRIGGMALTVISSGGGIGSRYSADVLAQVGMTPEVQERVDAAWDAMHDDFLTYSPWVRRVIVEGAGYDVHGDALDVVVEEIRRLAVY